MKTMTMVKMIASEGSNGVEETTADGCSQYIHGQESG